MVSHDSITIKNSFQGLADFDMDMTSNENDMKNKDELNSEI